MPESRSRRMTPRRLVAATGSVALLAAVPATAATASAAPAPTAGPAVTVFASGSSTVFGPDDIAGLGGHIFVAWQNGLGPAGQPSSTGATSSNVIEYSATGVRLAGWALKGHVDGLTADPAAGDVIATANEDGDSSLFTIDPTGPTGSQVSHYAYNLSPLPHGGGTDAVSIYHGQILISASAPTASSGPAVYKATLSGSTAVLQPVLFDNSSATVANFGADHGKTVTLALTDPDSNEVVPPAANRFGGDFMLDSQGDQQQIYVDRADTARPQLSVLNLSQSVDDTAFPTDTSGTLYVTDGADNEVFAVQGGFTPGTALVAVTPGDANNPVNAPNYLGRLDLSTGTVTPYITTVQAKGLLFTP